MTAPRLLVADHGRWLKPALGLLVTLAAVPGRQR
jgi:hypothetical protein